MKKIIFTSSMLLITATSIFYSCNKNNASTTPSNPYGGNNGNVTFWSSNVITNGVDVTINNQTLHISQFFPSSTPSCGQQGCASFNLPAGNYSYTALQTGGGCN